MAVVTQWNPKEETVREILALIDNIRQDIKELKELRQIKPPNQQIQGNQSSNYSGIHRQQTQTPAAVENQRQQTPIQPNLGDKSLLGSGTRPLIGNSMKGANESKNQIHRSHEANDRSSFWGSEYRDRDKIGISFFRSGADKVFEEMPSKEFLPFPYESPKFQSEVVDEEISGFNFLNPIDDQVVTPIDSQQVQASSQQQLQESHSNQDPTETLNESSGDSLKVNSEFPTLEFIDFLQEPLKVNSDSLEVEVSDVASDKTGAIDVSVESIEVCLGDFRVDSLDLLANQSAQQVFVVMPIRGSNISVPELGQGNRVFDPGIAEGLDYMSNGLSKKVEIPLQTLVIIVFDPGILHELELQAALTGGYWVLAGFMILVFDPGIVSKGDDRSAQLNIGCILEQFQVYYQPELRGFHFGGHIIRLENAYLLRVVEVVHQRLQWDPGGVDKFTSLIMFEKRAC